MDKKKKNAILAISERTKLPDVRKFGTNLFEMSRAVHAIFDRHRSNRRNGKGENLRLTNMHRKEGQRDIFNF